MTSKDSPVFEWHRDVRVPLRQCDYQEPLIVRTHPFIPDSPEAELDFTLAGFIVGEVPYWRRFKQWSDRRPPDAAYAEMRRLLLKHGYSEKDFERSSFPDVEEMLWEGSARDAADSLRAHMGGTWPREFRKLLLSSVGVWIEKPKVMDYWRKQIVALSESLGQYRSRKDAPDPWPFIGPDSRALRLPGDMPAVYTAIARLNDRLNSRSIITEELDKAPCQNGKDYTRLMDFFPGVNMVRYGRDVQYVDLDIVGLLIQAIGEDLTAQGLLTDEIKSPDTKTKLAGESGPDQRPDVRGQPSVTRAGGATHVEAMDRSVEQITAESMIKSKEDQGKYDVFLSHNSKDKAVAEEIAKRLKSVGIRPWLDKWDVVPGETVTEALEKAITNIKCAALFFGPSDVGRWHVMEIRAYIESKAAGEARFIPVILPGVKDMPELPMFVRQSLRVDMREWKEEGNDAFDRLVCGIIERPPGELPVDGFTARDVFEWQNRSR